MLWNKVQRCFFFPAVLFFTSHSFPSPWVLPQCSPSSNFAHQAHSPMPLLKSSPLGNMTLGWSSPLIEVLSTKWSLGLLKSCFRGYSGHEIGCDVNTSSVQGNLGVNCSETAVVDSLSSYEWSYVLTRCNSGYVTFSFIQSTWNFPHEIRFVIAAVKKS